MPTFKFNSDQPYYQDGRLVKKVKAKQEIRFSTLDCAVVGWTVARVMGKLTLALIFKRNPYRLS